MSPSLLSVHFCKNFDPEKQADFSLFLEDLKLVLNKDSQNSKSGNQYLKQPMFRDEAILEKEFHQALSQFTANQLSKKASTVHHLRKIQDLFASQRAFQQEGKDVDLVTNFNPKNPPKKLGIRPGNSLLI